LGLSPLKEPQTEFQFPSGDICDVVMDLGKEGWAVVEIKQGQRGELIKGCSAPHLSRQNRGKMSLEISHCFLEFPGFMQGQELLRASVSQAAVHV